MTSRSIIAGLTGLLFFMPVMALDYNGYLEGELRLYPDEGLYEEQKQALLSFATEQEMSWRSVNDDHGVRAKAFIRYSDSDGERDHGDIRELYYNYAGDGWQTEIGINKVFWGVTESAHLVDIINQTDNVESVTGEEKLGQPMISIGIEQGWGNLDFYILPGFREREYLAGPERFQLGFQINDNDDIYESDDGKSNIDYAVRWAHYFGDLDIGISWFNGTNREPIPYISDLDVPVSGLLAPNATLDPRDVIVSSYYEQIDNLGIEVQYIYEGWAFKWESISRFADSGDYNAIAAGFELTLFDMNPWGQDVGILVEYLWNDRDDISITELSITALQEDIVEAFPFLAGSTVKQIENNLPQAAIDQLTFSGDTLSPFNNDLFVGTRFTLNDISSTQFLAGIIVDLDDQTNSMTFEGSTRIGDRLRVTLNIYLFENVDEESAFYAFRKDDQIEAKAAWYF